MDQPFDAINRGAKAHVLLASHSAEVQRSPTYRARFTIDRWRLLTTILGGGHGRIVPVLPSTFPVHP